MKLMKQGSRSFPYIGLFKALSLLLYCFLVKSIQNFKTLGPTQPGSTPVLVSELGYGTNLIVYSFLNFSEPVFLSLKWKQPCLYTILFGRLN